MTMTQKHLLIMLGLSLAGFPLLGTGQDVQTEELINFGKKAPTKQEVLSVVTGTETLTTRGIARVPTCPSGKALAMEVGFEVNSSALTGASKQQLQGVGEALADVTMKNCNFRVEGHTDATGSKMRNRRLSQQRADAVVQYFVAEFAIEPVRLSAVGKGADEPIDPRNPASESNRRVEIGFLRKN